MTYSSGLYVIDYSPLTFIKERNLNLILIEPINHEIIIIFIWI